jgi:hypothetical protein
LSSADPPWPAAVCIDFTGMATGNATSYTVGDVTFSTTSGTLRIAPFGEGGSSWLGMTETLTTRDTGNSILDRLCQSRLGLRHGLGAASRAGMSLLHSAGNLLETLVFVGDTGATYSGILWRTTRWHLARRTDLVAATTG